MSETSIEWTDHSINPVRARNKKTGAVGHYCEKIAQGCANCYSSNFQKRFGMPPFGYGQHRDEVEIFLDESKLEEVRRRKKPTKYFWCDMTDIFGDWMEREWLVKCFATMDATPWHTHQLLTKRPENIPRMASIAVNIHSQPQADDRNERGELFRRNVWLGTSISNQADAYRKIRALLKARDLSPVLFVSAEPLLGPVDNFPLCHRRCGGFNPPQEVKDFVQAAGYVTGQRSFTGEVCGKGEYIGSNLYGSGMEMRAVYCQQCGYSMSGPQIDWVILGGESGHNSRPCNVAWIRSIKDQCKAAEVPVFVKQLGAMSIGGKQMTSQEWRLREPKGGDWMEWPEDLRVREFPKVKVTA